MLKKGEFLGRSKKVFQFRSLAWVIIVISTLFPILPAHGEDLNQLVLGKNDEIRLVLPALPSDPLERKQFLSLSPAEQYAFYLKRRYMVAKLASGMLRPGVRTTIRWIKRKSFFIKHKLIQFIPRPRKEIQSPALPLIRSPTFEWEHLPANMPQDTKQNLEILISKLVGLMWKQSKGIANSNGLGLTIVGGLIVNTSTPRRALVWGRSLSLDIGVDLKNQRGYFRVLLDKQAKHRPAYTLDVGFMFDWVLHLTDTEMATGHQLEAIHTKLPVVGCFRQGPQYTAFGIQTGFTALECVSPLAAFVGHPLLGFAAAIAIRLTEMSITYSTTLRRRILLSVPISEKWLRKIGFSKALTLADQLRAQANSCQEQF